MKLKFLNRKVEKIFSDKEIAKHFSLDIVARYRFAVRTIATADSLGERVLFEQLRLHELKGRDAGHYSIDVSKNRRLIICPHEVYGPRPREGYDLKKIKFIIIEEIRDTHEGKVRRK